MDMCCELNGKFLVKYNCVLRAVQLAMTGVFSVICICWFPLSISRTLLTRVGLYFFLFNCRGLLVSGMTDTAKGVIENLMELVERYGFVPNGARVYYENRRYVFHAPFNSVSSELELRCT